MPRLPGVRCVKRAIGNKPFPGSTRAWRRGIECKPSPASQHPISARCVKSKMRSPVLSTGDQLQPSIKPDLIMTTGQIRLVGDSVDTLREYAEPFALLFYGKLFELDPGSRLLFHNDLALQSRKLMDMVTSVVESLNDFEPMRARLAELGRKHAEYGVRPGQYETVTTAFLWSLGQALGADFDVPTREAWRLAINAICAAMKAGLA